MRFLRRWASALHDRLRRDRGPELSAEDEHFAERLSEMLRGYVEAEIPDSVVTRFRVPHPAGQPGRPTARTLPHRGVRKVTGSIRRRPATRPQLEVSHEDPH